MDFHFSFDLTFIFCFFFSVLNVNRDYKHKRLIKVVELVIIAGIKGGRGHLNEFFSKCL